MFSKEIEYALRSLVYIQSRNNVNHRPGIPQIASEIDAPQAFTAKILQRLVRLGLLNSMKGKGGGFYFDPEKPPLQIQTLVRALGGNKILDGCGFGLKQCTSENSCPIHDQYEPIRQSINHLLTSESIQSLAEKQTHLKEI
jgi:Rrf2 family protein